MISLSFVNNTTPSVITADPLFTFENVIEPKLAEVDSIYESVVDEIEQYLFEAEINGANETKSASVNAKKNNFFEELGKVIREAFENLITAFTNMITNIKQNSFKQKSDLEKIHLFTKKNPEEADKIMALLRTGDLSIQDLRSIDEMHEAYIAYLKTLQDKSIDPNTRQGKFELFKEKVKEVDKSAFIKGIGAASAVVGLTLSITNLVKFVNERPARANNLLKQQKEANAITMNVLDELSKRADDDSNLNTSLNNMSQAKQFKLAHDLYVGNMKKAGKALNKAGVNINESIMGAMSYISKTNLAPNSKNKNESVMIEAGFNYSDFMNKRRELEAKRMKAEDVKNAQYEQNKIKRDNDNTQKSEYEKNKASEEAKAAKKYNDIASLKKQSQIADTRVTTHAADNKIKVDDAWTKTKENEARNKARSNDSDTDAQVIRNANTTEYLKNRNAQNLQNMADDQESKNRLYDRIEQLDEKDRKQLLDFLLKSQSNSGKNNQNKPQK